MAETGLDQALRTQLSTLIGGGAAHVTLQAAAKDMPFHLQGVVPPGLPYSAWQVLEHLRRAQRDILDFSDNADGSYRPMQWPAEYWPRSPEPPAADAWENCLAAILQDSESFRQLLHQRALTEPFPWGEGQTLLREALLIADHESYHTGELVMLRRLLGAWQPKEGHA